MKLMEETKIGIDYNNDSHKEYCSKRTFILNFLKSLIDLHHFRESVYFLAVLYLDIILLSNPNYNYEMAAYSCFLLASKKIKFNFQNFLGKFYEYDPKLPSMRQLTESLMGKFSEKDIKKSEMICLKLLGYKLDRNSPYDFLEYFLKNGILFENEYLDHFDEFELKEIYDFPYKILNFFLFDSRYLDFTPLQITCAIITFTREKFKLRESWSRKFSEIYNIKLEDFMNCYFVVKTIYAAEKEPAVLFRPMERKNSDLYISLTRGPYTSNKIIPGPSLAIYYNNDLQPHQLDEVRTPNMIKRRSVNDYYFPANYSRASGDELNSTLDESYCMPGARSKSISNSSVHQTKYRNSAKNINSIYQISRNLNSNFNLYGGNYHSTGEMPMSISPFNVGYSSNNCYNNISFPVISDNSTNVYNNYFFQ
jgi:hypothetical protein